MKEVVEKTRPSHNDSLFLNAGDEFQVRTLIMHFYRLSHIRGREVICYCMQIGHGPHTAYMPI